MNTIRVCTTLVLCLLVLCLAPFTVAATFSGTVVGISDGDTLQVLHQGKAVKIRLHDIDTPERGQAYGTRAKQFTAALAFGQEVTVRIVDTDRYGRPVVVVTLPDGRNLNQELVRAGYAWWYRDYAPKEKTLQRLEAEARTAGRGLWTDPNPIPPWEWRQTERERKEKDREQKPPSLVGEIIGNSQSHLYRWPGCPGYGKGAAKHQVVFWSRAEAEAQGYRPAKSRLTHEEDTEKPGKQHGKEKQGNSNP